MVQFNKFNSKFKRGVTWIIWSGVLAVAGLGGWLVYERVLRYSSEPVPVRLLAVKKGKVENILNESGTVELAGQRTLKSPADGTVAQVLVKVSDRVKSAQELVILRDPKR